MSLVLSWIFKYPNTVNYNTFSYVLNFLLIQKYLSFQSTTVSEYMDSKTNACT